MLTCLLSLPADDLQYTLNSMDLSDLIALSLCSKRTKNLAKTSNLKIESITAEIEQNVISLEMFVLGKLEKEIKFVVHKGPSMELHRGNRIEVWRKEGFTQSDWIAHFLSLCDSRVTLLKINNVPSIAHLDTVKQLFPKCDKLQICENNSIELTRAAVSKFLSLADEVRIECNPFDDKNHISELLSLNSKVLRLYNVRNVYKLKLSDLLMANSTYLNIFIARISVKELNRFVKVWMKGNRRFYRPKRIGLFLNRFITHEEVLRGIEYEAVDGQRRKYRLRRSDGKELLVLVELLSVAFEFL
ncbi:hypothetical protein B9Z55_021603 [Caenorhabditis nigoni]|uniref:F-box domain-containing protein n=2 Tax=Caenorhabditis nigoni TaxID=1611254 RepID=A0A2G5TSV3_9PELO|nr:hypothetical protein B9Z55_021603 [Caenorhabditis nigoni]